MQITWIDLANFILALSGFGLAAYTLYLQRLDRRPRLIVEANLTLRKLTEHHKDIWHKEDFCVVIKLRNPTENDIQVEDIFYVSKEGEATRITPQDPPLVLSHKTSEVIMKREHLMRYPRITANPIGHFAVKDALGNTSRSLEASYEISDRQAFFPSIYDWRKWVMSGVKAKRDSEKP